MGKWQILTRGSSDFIALDQHFNKKEKKITSNILCKEVPIIILENVNSTKNMKKKKRDQRRNLCLSVLASLVRKRKSFNEAQ